MWNALSNLAEKAKAAAADLEGQINESVGVVEVPTEKSKAQAVHLQQDSSIYNDNKNDNVTSGIYDDNADGDNDVDDDDDVWKDDDFDVDTTITPTIPLVAPSNSHQRIVDTPVPPVPSVAATTTTTTTTSPREAFSNETNNLQDSDWKPSLSNNEEDTAAGADESGWGGQDELEDLDADEQVPTNEIANSATDETPHPEEMVQQTVQVQSATHDEQSPALLTTTETVVTADSSMVEANRQDNVQAQDFQKEEEAVIEAAELKDIHEDMTDGDGGWQEELELDDDQSEQPIERESNEVAIMKPDKSGDSIIPLPSLSETSVADKEIAVDEKINESLQTKQTLAEHPVGETTKDITLADETPSVPKPASVEQLETESPETRTLVNKIEEEESSVAPTKMEVNVASSLEHESDGGEITPKESKTVEIVGNGETIHEAVNDEEPSDVGTEQQLLAAQLETQETVEDSQPTQPNETDPVAVSSTNSLKDSENGVILQQYQQLVEQLQNELHQREAQLISRTQQMTEMEAMFESEKQELVQVVEKTKAEAKRRIQMAKERVEKAEGQVAQLSRGQSEDAQKQAQIINELRSEGEKLAHKQAEMERAVRSAKGEARQYRDNLEREQIAKEEALDKIAQLQAELKSTKEQLVSARKGESLAGKLENDLQSAREEAERKASTVLSLEQQVKELKSEAKDLMTQLEAARKGAAVETEREQKKLRKEQSNLIDDFETKLRTTEKEAALREDALRHEVNELRKRWQDAVRRADALSMDVQSSTAPLMRQLESMERQNRARAAAWTELENKLRQEVEETMIANEKLIKEKSEIRTKLIRVERASKENEVELRQTQKDLEEKTYKVKEIEDKLHHLEEEGVKREKEWAEVERLANEGVARVRSEMSQTMLELDERHRGQLDSLQSELRKEREKRTQLEQQLQELVDRAGAIVPVHVYTQPLQKNKSAPKLRNSEGQAEILAGALGDMSDGDLEDDEEDSDDEQDDENNIGRTSSFAALEELTSRLKSTKIELNTLRKSLADSETTRAKLMQELSEARGAQEKLPLFETRVKELTVENEQMAQEIAALQEDIADVRDLYRSQLNTLLEEKAAKLSNGAFPSEHFDQDDGEGDEGEPGGEGQIPAI